MLLVQLFQTILCTSLHATTDMVSCNGTAALSVADGRISGQCHTRKRFIDFRSFAGDGRHPRSEAAWYTHDSVGQG